MNSSFPSCAISPERAQKDFTKLQKFAETQQVADDTVMLLNVHNLGRSCSNLFFQPHRLETKMAHRNNLSVLDAWKEPKWARYFDRYIKGKSRASSFSQVAFRFGIPTQFPASVAVQIYKRFSARAVFDPYAGWGDRMVAAMACGIRYTGSESNLLLEKPYAEMLSFFQPLSQINIYFQKAETLDMGSFYFDLLFSSPPFYDAKGKLREIYNGTETMYSKFLEESLLHIVRQVLKMGKPVILHLPLQMKEDLEQELGPPREVLEMPSGGRWRNKKKEFFYVWKT